MMVVKLVLFFLISAATITETAPAVVFDYLQLEQSWPPSTCAVEGCSSSSLPEMFTIHGLWPLKDGRPVINCAGANFNKSKIATLIPKMTRYWRSIPPTIPVEAFWAHQWNVHGKCTNLPFVQYFNVTLQRYLEYDLLAMLKNNGITPGYSYDPTKIHRAIYAKTAYVPTVRCLTVKGVQVLYSAALCYNKTATKLVDCPEPTINCNPYNDALLDTKTHVSKYKPGTKDGLWSM